MTAIRSGAGVSNATTKFRHTIMSSRRRSTKDETLLEDDLALFTEAAEEQDGKREGNGGDETQNEVCM